MTQFLHTTYPLKKISYPHNRQIVDNYVDNCKAKWIAYFLKYKKKVKAFTVKALACVDIFLWIFALLTDFQVTFVQQRMKIKIEVKMKK